MLSYVVITLGIMFTIALFADENDNYQTTCQVCDGKINSGSISCVHCGDDRQDLLDKEKLVDW